MLRSGFQLAVVWCRGLLPSIVFVFAASSCGEVRQLPPAVAEEAMPDPPISKERMLSIVDSTGRPLREVTCHILPHRIGPRVTRVTSETGQIPIRENEIGQHLTVTVQSPGYWSWPMSVGLGDPWVLVVPRECNVEVRLRGSPPIPLDEEKHSIYADALDVRLTVRSGPWPHPNRFDHARLRLTDRGTAVGILPEGEYDCALSIYGAATQVVETRLEPGRLNRLPDLALEPPYWVNVYVERSDHGDWGRARLWYWREDAAYWETNIGRAIPADGVVRIPVGLPADGHVILNGAGSAGSRMPVHFDGGREASVRLRRPSGVIEVAHSMASVPNAQIVVQRLADEGEPYEIWFRDRVHVKADRTPIAVSVDRGRYMVRGIVDRASLCKVTLEHDGVGVVQCTLEEITK